MSSASSFGCMAIDGARIQRLYLFTHGQEALYSRLGWEHVEPTIWYGHACSIMSKAPRLYDQAP